MNAYNEARIQELILHNEKMRNARNFAESADFKDILIKIKEKSDECIILCAIDCLLTRGEIKKIEILGRMIQDK